MRAFADRETGRKATEAIDGLRLSPSALGFTELSPRRRWIFAVRYCSPRRSTGEGRAAVRSRAGAMRETESRMPAHKAAPGRAVPRQRAALNACDHLRPLRAGNCSRDCLPTGRRHLAQISDLARSGRSGPSAARGIAAKGSLLTARLELATIAWIDRMNDPRIFGAKI